MRTRWVFLHRGLELWRCSGAASVHVLEVTEHGRSTGGTSIMMGLISSLYNMIAFWFATHGKALCSTHMVLVHSTATVLVESNGRLAFSIGLNNVGTVYVASNGHINL
jgi:hypothetical protein